MKATHTSLQCVGSWSDNTPCLRSARKKKESTEGTQNRELADTEVTVGRMEVYVGGYVSILPSPLITSEF